MQEIQMVAEKIKSLCDIKGVSINKMLSDSEAGNRTYHNMLAGSCPSVDKIDKIADYFDCSVDYILGRTDVPEVNYHKSAIKNLHMPIEEDVRLIAEPNIPETTFFDPDEDENVIT